MKEKKDKVDETGFKSVTPKYTVDKIVRHVSTGDNIRYVARWHEYTAKGDTIEPPDLIAQQ